MFEIAGVQPDLMREALRLASHKLPVSTRVVEKEHEDGLMAKKTNNKFADLTALDDTRLERELEDTYRQLFTLRLQVATRQLSNVKEIGKVRRKIARIKTLQRNRELVTAGGAR